MAFGGNHQRVRARVPLLALAGLALVAAACVPLQNAPEMGPPSRGTFRIGPFMLNPGQEASGSRQSVPMPSVAHGIKKASFTLVDANGNEFAREDFHLHHILLIDPDTPDALCPGRGERFIGSGQERTPIDIWGPYAYKVGAGERIDALFHVMDTRMAGAPQQAVYIQWTLEYVTGADVSEARGVKPYFQDVTGCGGSTYDVPGNGGPGSMHTLSRTWTAPSDGIAVYTGGHQHHGGMGIVLKRTSDGEVACESMPEHDESEMGEGHPMSMNPCYLHHEVDGGAQYTVESRYDNSEPHQDVMGIMLTYVWHGSQ